MQTDALGAFSLFSFCKVSPIIALNSSKVHARDCSNPEIQGTKGPALIRILYTWFGYIGRRDGR
jgi:hypothetical protein